MRVIQTVQRPLILLATVVLAQVLLLAVQIKRGDVRLIRGKQVVNLLPRDAPHKGIALEKARARVGCDTAVYVGDDETDEDVFGLDRPGRLLTVRVGRKRDSLASYFLRDQSEIDRLLIALLSVVPERRPGGVRRAEH